MSEALVNLISEARRLKTSFVSRLSDEDVASVWALVSEFVEKQMLQRKGVSIQNLGTFSFAMRTVDIGNNRSIALQRPVFLLSEKFAQTHCIRYAKQHAPGQIPVVALNYTILANYSPFDRDTVEMCVKEILHTFSYVVGVGKSIELPLVSVGKLVVRDGRAKMKFFRDFIQQLDSSGQLEDAFHQRSATAMSTVSMQSEASIISNRVGSVLSRPGTTGSVVLPKIVEPSFRNSLSLTCSSPNSGGGSGFLSTSPKMPPISEEEACGGGNQEHSSDKAPTTAGSVAGGSLSPSVPKPTLSPRLKGKQLEGLEEHGEEKRQCSDSMQEEECEGSCSRPSTCFHPMSRGQELCYVCHQRAVRNIPVSFTEENKQREKLEDQVLQEYLQKKDALEMAKDQIQNLHHREESKKVAAFNLCMADVKHAKKVARSDEFHPSYVFQERAVTPPKQAKQAQYCKQLDKQVHQRKTHHEAVKREVEEKDRQEKFLIANELLADHKEFVRHQLKRKQEYQEALAEQVNIRNELQSTNTHRQHTRATEEDSVSVSSAGAGSGVVVASSMNASSVMSPGKAEALTAPMSRPANRRRQDLRPLSLPKPTFDLPISLTKSMLIEENGKIKLVRFKPPPLPACEPDSVQPIFGVHDVTQGRQREQRQRAKQLFQDQLEMVKQKQQLSSLKAQKNQSEEADMLKRAKQDLLEEYHQKLNARGEVRRSLDEAWKQGLLKKKEREMADERHEEAPSILLHQQCDRYKRCKQCKRRTSNVGGSNVLAESRYISGARLMV